MDFLHSLLLTGHFVGLALLIGTFFVQLRAKWGFAFPVMLTGAALQLVTGLSLYGLLIANPDATPNHMKLGIKGLIAVAIFVAALIGFLKQRKLAGQQAALKPNATVASTAGEGIASVAVEKSLLPFFHAAGALALINLLLAVFWH